MLSSVSGFEASAQRDLSVRAGGLRGVTLHLHHAKYLLRPHAHQVARHSNQFEGGLTQALQIAPWLETPRHQELLDLFIRVWGHFNHQYASPPYKYGLLIVTLFSLIGTFVPRATVLTREAHLDLED